MFCRREWARKRYAENPEYRQKVIAAGRAYRASHKEEIRERWRLKWRTDPAYRAKRRIHNRIWERKKEYREIYGITLEDFDLMLTRQHGVCAICRTKPPERLSVDHCHATGKVRGLLCSKCNCGLGFFRDEPRRLRAAAKYLLASRRRKAVRSKDAGARNGAARARPRGGQARARQIKRRPRSGSVKRRSAR